MPPFDMPPFDTLKNCPRVYDYTISVTLDRVLLQGLVCCAPPHCLSHKQPIQAAARAQRAARHLRQQRVAREEHRDAAAARAQRAAPGGQQLRQADAQPAQVACDGEAAARGGIRRAAPRRRHEHSVRLHVTASCASGR